MWLEEKCNTSLFSTAPPGETPQIIVVRIGRPKIPASRRNRDHVISYLHFLSFGDVLTRHANRSQTREEEGRSVICTPTTSSRRRVTQNDPFKKLARHRCSGPSLEGYSTGDGRFPRLIDLGGLRLARQYHFICQRACIV